MCAVPGISSINIVNCGCRRVLKGLQKKAACPFNVVIFAKRDPLSAEVCGMLPE